MWTMTNREKRVKQKEKDRDRDTERNEHMNSTDYISEKFMDIY